MEQQGGLYFVEGHNKANERGSLAKRYYSGGEAGVRKEFFPNTWFKTVECLTNDTLDFSTLAQRLKHHKEFNRATLPTACSLHADKYWRKQKQVLPDLPSIALICDIDCKWSDLDFPRLPSCTPLADIVHTVLSRSFPNHTNLGYVARYSSSARIQGEDHEVRIRIYLLLDRPIDSEERIKRFAGIPLLDAAVFEKNCLDLIRDPVIMDRNVPLVHIPYQEIIYRDGDRLPVDDFPAIYSRSSNTGNTTKGAGFGNGAYHKLVAEYEETNKVKLKPNSPGLYQAITEMAEAGKLEHNRFSVHFWLMLECYRHDANCFTAMSYIANNEKVLGKNRTLKDLIALEQQTRAYFRNKWCGTPIAETFEKKEILTLKGLDVAENTWQIAHWFKERIDPFDDNGAGNVVVDCQPIGAGKTSGSIRYFCELYNDDRISICYRKSILLMHCKELGFTYYLDVPEAEIAKQEDGKEWAKSLTDQFIKEFFLDLNNTPAITIQSLTWLQRQMQGRYHSPGLVVLDEPERVLQELFIKPKLAYEKEHLVGINETYRLFMELCHNAHTVLLADADASVETTGWLVETLSKAGKKKHLIANEADWYRGKRFCEFDTRGFWLAALKKMYDAGDTILVHTDLGDDTAQFSTFCDAIVEHLGLEEHQIVGYHRDTPGADRLHKETNVVLAEHRLQGARIVVISPIVQIGTNHTGKPFDRVMLYFHHGNTVGPDTFQTLLRDRKADWFGFFFASKVRRTKHDTTSEAFEANSEYSPHYVNDTFEDLQKKQTRRYINARENPRGALLTLIEERAGTENLVDFDMPITWLEQKNAAEIISASKENREELRIEKVKANLEILGGFVALGRDQDGWSYPQVIEDIADIDEDDLKKIGRLFASGERSTAKALVDLWFMDEEQIRQTSKQERLAFRILQAELLGRVKRVFLNYFASEVDFHQALQKGENGALVLIEGEPGIQQFNAWIKDNAERLEISALLEIPDGWKSSPYKIIEKAFDYLGFDTEVLPKIGGKSDQGEKIASKVAAECYEYYLRTKQIKRTKRVDDRKTKMLKIIQEKLKRGRRLTDKEMTFYRSLGRVMAVTPRSFVDFEIWKAVAQQNQNPHYKEWHDKDLVSLNAAKIENPAEREEFLASQNNLEMT